MATRPRDDAVAPHELEFGSSTRPRPLTRRPWSEETIECGGVSNSNFFTGPPLPSEAADRRRAAG